MKKGEVAEIQTRGPHRRLEAEAERVTKLIPKMAPGKQRGRPVSVVYSLPVVFEMRPSR
ncbi:MAG: energy transducer TonB [Bacteroidota bacterium]